MDDASRATAVGVLLGSSAIFGYHAFSAVRHRVETPEHARQSAGEKIVTAGIFIAAVYLTWDLNYRLYQALVGEGKWPEELGL